MKTLDGVIIIGLTGQSGAGKSTASKLFSESGLAVIDCDKIARAAADIPEFLSETEKLFPGVIIDGALDRQKLAGIVFNNSLLLKRYTSLIFPYITALVFKHIRELKSAGERIIILDAPTLFESGLDVICNAVISVIAPFDVKLRRILERDGIPVELIRSRISSQHDEEYFSKRSDYVIHNDGNLDALKQNVSKVADAVKERFDV